MNGATGSGHPTASAVPGGQGISGGSVVAGDAGIVVSTAAGVATVSQVVAAEWSVGVTRVYAVDFVNGLDSNQGYADALSSSAADYAIACALAGTRAKKTLSGLGAIFPRLGTGRDAEIVIRNGGVNTVQNYAENLGVILSGISGYNKLAVRGTGTNTTAGVVAFDGSTADATYQGAITVTGLNAAGYNPTAGATTTSLPCQLAGGGAAALPAEPAAPLGWRVRFDAATATASLRNQCRMITQVTGGTTIIPLTAFSAAPGLTDVFYIEQAGITVPLSLISMPGSGNLDQTSGQQYNISGLRCTSTLRLLNGDSRFSFCGASSFITTGPACQFVIAQTFTHPVLGSLTVGGGLRCETSASWTGAGNANITALVAVTSVTASQTDVQTYGVGCYAGTALSSDSSNSGTSTSGATGQIGTPTALGKTRAQRLSLIAIKGQISGITLAGAGANPAITVQGMCFLTFFNGVVDGVTGNNDVGLDLTNSRNSIIILATTPTVTGALGDVRLGNGQIVTWAAAAGIDSFGNRILIVTGNAVPSLPNMFTGALFGGAGAVLSYCANTSPTLLVANELVATRYQTASRFLQTLRVTTLAASTNTINNTVTVLLNGVVTALSLTIPPATAAFTKFVASIVVYCATGDDLSIQVSNGGADVGAVAKISAVLEWCA